jgi:predicted metalloprotease with PDZ domain
MRTASLALLALFAAAAQSADYSVEADSRTGSARVRVKVESPAPAFSMPAWAPGDYQVFDFGTRISSLEARLKGQAVEALREGPNRWILPRGADEITYAVGPSGGNFSPNLRVRPGEAFISGPGVFGWVQGDEKNPQRLVSLTIDGAVHPAACPLPRSREGFWTARDYDHFIDSPIASAAGLQSQEVPAGGADHTVAVYGQLPEGAVIAPFAPVIEPLVREAVGIFGGLPYERYIFFADIRGGYGGLEHQDSCRLTLSRPDPRGAELFIAHEYFHAFNVKRIREWSLGPFDYSKAARVETLWWLEGVTDYYAGILAARGGLISEERLRQDLARTRAGVMRDPDSARVSAKESSLRVWEQPGSQGYGISYYAKGKVIGWTLDLAIRRFSGGGKSLDDVLRSLYAECLSGPGYPPERIRELCIEHGGPQLAEIYRKAVEEPGDVPIDDLLTEMDGAWPSALRNPAPSASIHLH